MRDVDAATLGPERVGRAPVHGVADLETQAFGLLLPPSQAGLIGGALASMLIYVVMAVILAVRPRGLFAGQG